VGGGNQEGRKCTFVTGGKKKKMGGEKGRPKKGVKKMPGREKGPGILAHVGPKRPEEVWKGTGKG